MNEQIQERMEDWIQPEGSASTPSPAQCRLHVCQRRGCRESRAPQNKPDKQTRLRIAHRLAEGENHRDNVLYSMLPHNGQGTAYSASAHGTDAVCDLSRLQAEGTASPQLLIPQFDGPAFFWPNSHPSNENSTYYWLLQILLTETNTKL